MRVIYKGKFREDLNDYINDQPWMFELDGAGMSFWELPICMQWGVVKMFAFMKAVEINNDPFTDSLLPDTVIKKIKFEIEQFQKWYNENN